MARQQSLFTFQGKKIDSSQVKIKATTIPGPPLAEGEIIELAIIGTARAFNYERDKDGQLVATAIIQIDASKILAAGTFDELDTRSDAELVSEVLKETVDQINAGALDTAEHKVTASVG